jgi:hypothetical protein
VRRGGTDPAPKGYRKILLDNGLREWLGSVGARLGCSGRVGNGKARRKLPGAVAEMGPGYLKRFG